MCKLGVGLTLVNSFILGCFRACGSQDSKMVMVETTSLLEAWASELATCHFHHILLIEASHKTNPDTKDEE